MTVRLWNGTGAGGDAAGDTLSDIESVIGSDFADALIGTLGSVNNTLSGGGGNDFLAGLGGADVLFGGAGVDTADYSGSSAGVTVRLWNGTGEGGSAEGDTLSDIENLNGSAFNDALLGSLGAVANTLSGGAGNDYLNGLGGNDNLFGGTGADILDGGAGADILSGGAGADKFVFGTGSGADTVTLFEDGSDLVDLTGTLTFADLTLSAISGGVRVEITGTPADHIDLLGVALENITASDFI